jgi:hypothetical protein
MRSVNFFFLLAAFLLFANVSGAQTAGSTTNTWGTNYWPILVSPGFYQTNQVYQQGAYKPITLGNITSTNEVVQGWYAINPTNGLTPAPGYPGYYIIGTFSNNFVSGTNSGSWATNFNGSGLSVVSPVVIGVGISGGVGGTANPYTNTIYIP